MKINIITIDNGAGLSVDARILMNILGKKHDVQFINLWKIGKLRMADVNLWLEYLTPLVKLAPVNYMMPNPEWFNDKYAALLHKVNLILAKTKDTQNIFNRKGLKTFYTSFTSRDQRDTEIKRDKVFFHLAGYSASKGTQDVHALWSMHANFPTLILIQHDNIFGLHKKNENQWYNFGIMKNEEIKVLQNRCLFHICPSKYEGFGHYIHEAKSCEGIVITTNHPPMNEVITEKSGYLINVRDRKPMCLAQTGIVDVIDMKNKILTAFNMDERQIKEMQQAARQEWEDNDKFFKSKIIEVFA